MTSPLITRRGKGGSNCAKAQIPSLGRCFCYGGAGRLLTFLSPKTLAGVAGWAPFRMDFYAWWGSAHLPLVYWTLPCKGPGVGPGAQEK